MFTTSAIQDRTFAIVHATETVTGYGARHDCRSSNKQLTSSTRWRNVDEVLRSTAGMRLGPSSKPIVTRH